MCGACVQALPGLQVQLQAQLAAEGMDVAALLRPTSRRSGPSEEPSPEDSEDAEPAR